MGVDIVAADEVGFANAHKLLCWQTPLKTFEGFAVNDFGAVGKMQDGVVAYTFEVHECVERYGRLGA